MAILKHSLFGLCGTLRFNLLKTEKRACECEDTSNIRKVRLEYTYIYVIFVSIYKYISEARSITRLRYLGKVFVISTHPKGTVC